MEKLSWSSDCARIAYISGPFHEEEVWVVNSNGTGKRNVSNTPGGDLHHSWSPDGTRIVFSSEKEEGSLWYGDEIYVVNADGSGLKNLSNSPEDDTGPTWSPDGRQIAFMSLRDDNVEIYVVNSDRSGLKNLTRSPAADTAPEWSPDGTWIVFVSDRDDRDGDIYLMNAKDGSGQRNLSNNPAAECCPLTAAPPNPPLPGDWTSSRAEFGTIRFWVDPGRTSISGLEIDFTGPIGTGWCCGADCIDGPPSELEGGPWPISDRTFSITYSGANVRPLRQVVVRGRFDDIQGRHVSGDFIAVSSLNEPCGPIRWEASHGE